MTAPDHRLAAAMERIRELEDENAWLRAMSSAGFARGMIKRAPKEAWAWTKEVEDLS